MTNRDILNEAAAMNTPAASEVMAKSLKPRRHIGRVAVVAACLVSALLGSVGTAVAMESHSNAEMAQAIGKIGSSIIEPAEHVTKITLTAKIRDNGNRTYSIHTDLGDLPPHEVFYANIETETTDTSPSPTNSTD